MDLGLSAIRTKGNAAKFWPVTFVRPLEEADIPLLDLPRGSVPTALKRISERHRKLARLLGKGASVGEAALAAGYNLATVSILQSDPMFKELVEFHREKTEEQINEAFGDTLSNLAAIGNESLDILQRKQEEDPDSITVGQHIEIVKMALDRTGYGPASSQTNVNIYVGTAERLKAARLKAREAAKMIDVTPNE